MRIIRILLAICAAAAVGLFAVSEILTQRNRDSYAPQITAETDLIEVPCDYTREDLMQGIRAWDEMEGDLTDQVVISTFSRFLQDGVCNLTYVVFDGADQSASVTRKVKFADYHSPRFALSEPLVFPENEGSYTKIIQALSAWDVLDGDRTDWMVRTNTNLDFQIAGTYYIAFEVTNSFGDSSAVQLPVHVTKEQNGEGGIVLNTGLVYLTVGQSLNPSQYVSSVTAFDGTPMDISSLNITSQVDTTKPGCYEIHYEAVDYRENHYETWLTVIVEGSAA